MAEGYTTSLAEVKIQGVGKYHSVMSLQINTQENSHGVMLVTLCLDSDVPGFNKKDWKGLQIQAVAGTGQVLFDGECINFYQNEFSQYCEVTLYVVSQSYQTDIVQNSRTFQSTTKTFREVVDRVFGSYGAQISIDEDKSIPIMLVQEKETDWKFIIRIANQYGYQVYTDVSSQVLRIGFGTSGKMVSDFYVGAIQNAETKNPQELRMKQANQGEDMGMYHYAREEICSYNPYGVAGTLVDGKVIQSSEIRSERGILVNHASTAYPKDALPNSESMMAESYSSHILSGTVLAVNDTTIKVQFDVDASQSEAEARELPYENTINNSFYCLPGPGDKVFGYIDNRGTAVILGCKRRDTQDAFYQSPEEKAITVLDNMIHFAQNNLTLSANREISDKEETKRISIMLNKEQGIDIHASGSIIVSSTKTVGLMAGKTTVDVKQLEKRYKKEKTNGENKYITDGGAELIKKGFWSETGKQIGDSYQNFFNSMTLYEVRKDIGNALFPEKMETERENFEQGTVYMGGEQITLVVGNSFIILGAEAQGNVSTIYINAELFEWLGFVKKEGYEKVEETYSDGWETFLDIASLVLDIAAVVVFCVCPVAGLVMMGVSAAITLARGDYCGALLACIPIAGEVKLGAKLISKLPKFEKVIKVLGIICDKVDTINGVMSVAGQIYSTGKKMYNGQMQGADWAMLALTAVSIITDKATESYCKNHGVGIGGSQTDAPGGTSNVDVDAPDAPSIDTPNNHPDMPSQTPDTPNQTPDAPSQTPDAPGQTPDTPNQTPDAPSQTPDAPGQTPDAPGQTPDAPSQTPDAPNQTPDAPSQTPGGQEAVAADAPDSDGKNKADGDDTKKNETDDGKKSGEDSTNETNPEDGQQSGDDAKNNDGEDCKEPDTEPDNSTDPQNTEEPEVEADSNETKTTGADPVDVVTGALTEQHTDLRMKDIREDYAVVRTYKSTIKNEGKILGSRWIFQFEVSLYRQDNYISIYLPDAHKEQFALTDAGWSNQVEGKEKYDLKETKEGYELEEHDTEKTYYFNRKGHILCISDSYHNQIRYKYIGNLISEIQLESGLSLYLSYEHDKLSLLRDSQGREYHYRYDKDLLTSVTYPNGGTITYEYTKEGFITRIHNETGKCYVTNQFDRKGRVVRQNTADGEEYIFFYNDAEKETILTTTGLNRSIKYCYNRNKLVVKTIYEDGTTEEKRYDSNEKVIWEKDRLGRETNRSYDAKGKLIFEITPDGLQKNYSYNEKGKCIAQEDTAGRKIKYAYDLQGGLSEASFMVEEGVYLTTRYERDNHGRIICQRNADGSEKAWEYDKAFAHPTSFYGAEGESFRYELDDFGRKMICHGARGDVYYGYNTNHFVTMVRDEENNCTRYQYDLTGNKVGILLPEDVAADDGRNITYTYDLMDHLTGMMDPCGNGYTQEVDSEGKPLTRKSRGESGAATTYRYDSDGRRTHVCYPDGGILRNFYDACGNLVKQVAPEDYNEATDNGQGMTFAYDAMNRLIGVWNKAGQKIRGITYDLAGRVIKDSRDKQLTMQDEQGEEIGTLYKYNYAGWLLEERVPVQEEGGKIYYRLTRYSYDKRGNCTHEKRYLDAQSKESASGRILLIQKEYDKSGRLVQITDSIGSSQEYRYDSHNKVVYERRKIREDVYQEKKYSYTKAGNMESVEESADAKGCGRYTVKTRYHYNRNGKLTEVITPTGNKIRMEYDRCNRLLKQEKIQRDGTYHSIMEMHYDTEGRLCRQIQDETQYEYGYDICGRRNRISDQNGSTKAWIYDKNNRVVCEIGAKEYRRAGFNGRGRSICYEDDQVKAVYRMDGSLEREYVYDAYGFLIWQTEGSGAKIHLAYDLSGRRIQAKTDSGATQTWNYDPWGNISYVIDGNGNTTGFYYDGWGKVTRIDRADGAIESYAYDAAGNLTEAIDAKGGTIKFLYNSQNRLAERIDQSGNAEYWNYDAEGRCCSYTDRNKSQIQYTYNMAGSLLSRRSNKENTYGETYGYTKEGRLHYAIGGGMRYDYVYDEAGRLTRKKASGRTLMEYTYDADGMRTSQKDLTGKETRYQYNEYGMLSGISEEESHLADYTYTPEGRIAQVVSGPLTSSYSYDAEGSLRSLTTMLGEEVLVSNNYSYDYNGNCIQKETMSGMTQYTYDSMNRLHEVNNSYGTEIYNYDYADNRISKETYGFIDGEEQLLIKEQYEYDERNRLVRSLTQKGQTPDTQDFITEYTYDNQGNLLSDGRGTYSYDPFNRMEKAELPDGQTQINRYDAEGLRHELVENGKLVQFLYSKREVVVETEEEGNTIRYIRGLGLISSDSEKAKTYYHYASDELGSITHVVTGLKKEQTEADNLKAQNSDTESVRSKETQILNRYEYDTFGNATLCEETIENRFRFTGQQYDTITGQYYLRARFYNPVIGRFLQEDNYYGDGLNLYAYCRNNPVKYVDPSGHGTESAADKNQGDNNTELTPEQQALQDIVNEQNQNGGHDSSDQQTVKDWADECGMNYDDLGVQPRSETSYGKSSIKNKTGPKPKGTGPHNLKIEEIASQVTDGKIIAGGGRGYPPEAVIKTPGGIKSSRRPDILIQRPDGSMYGINVGKTTAKGAPIKREVEAIYDLEDVGIPMYFVGYDK